MRAVYQSKIGIPVTLAKHRGPIGPAHPVLSEDSTRCIRRGHAAGRLCASPMHLRRDPRTRVSPAGERAWRRSVDPASSL